jgi:hypothetical protein
MYKICHVLAVLLVWLVVAVSKVCSEGRSLRLTWGEGTRLLAPAILPAVAVWIAITVVVWWSQRVGNRGAFPSNCLEWSWTGTHATTVFVLVLACLVGPVVLYQYSLAPFLVIVVGVLAASSGCTYFLYLCWEFLIPRSPSSPESIRVEQGLLSTIFGATAALEAGFLGGTLVAIIVGIVVKPTPGALVGYSHPTLVLLLHFSVLVFLGIAVVQWLMRPIVERLCSLARRMEEVGVGPAGE